MLLTAWPAGSADIRPPVELFAPTVWNLAAAVRESVYPEVDLRIAIDPRGKVTEVEIRSITPSTHLDPEIRTHVEATLLQWRYAPKLVDGEAVASELSWTLQFRDYGSGNARIGGSRPRGDQFTYIGSPFGPSKEQRLRVLERATSQAYKLLDGDHLRSRSSQLFVVHTDAERAETVEQLAQNINAIFATLHDIFSPGIELSAPLVKLQVIAFAHRDRFEEFRSRISPVYEWASGFYLGAGLVAIHLEHRHGDSILGALLHETTHAFVNEHVTRPDRPLPKWFGEGFATYLENSTIKKGRLVPGRTLRREFKMVQGSVVKRTAQSYFDLETAKKALRQGRGPTIKELLTTDIDSFYGERRQLYYPASWLLVHFLRHADAGWAQDEFPRMVLYVAEGFSGVETLEAVYGKRLAELEGDFKEYLRTF